MNAETFDRLRRDYDVIPIVRGIDSRGLTPVDVFAALGGSTAEAFLFESAISVTHEGRFSFVGVSPRASLSWNRDSEEPVAVLRAALRPLRVYDSGSLPPFFGGAVGFLGYGVARWLEQLPDRHEPQAIPEAKLLLFDELIAFDHSTDSVLAIANVHTDGPRSSAELLRDAKDRLDHLSGPVVKWSSGQVENPAPLDNSTTQQLDHWVANCTREDFQKAVGRAKEEIAAGEAFQIVVSQRWETPFPTNEALALYRALREINPSPYMFLLRTRECTLVGASPEMLVRVTGDLVETRPIAGTRPRGRTPAEDATLETELLADQKESAEHLMLVDLGRNDLGRVSRRGSVKVTEFRSIERYSHVMHIVSHVIGKLRPELLPIDALLAAFPAGTVTGAPKIRAMELIDELEFSRRGPYAGAVLYAGYSGNLDSCIAIRTIVLHDHRAFVQAGAGIVFDSDPAREYDETMNKAAAMKEALCHSERSAATAFTPVKRR